MEERRLRYCNFKMLRFVRDNQPTESELLAFIEKDSELELWHVQAQYAYLRKSGMVVLKEGKWVLLPDCLSSNGKSFQWGHQRLLLDEDIVDTF